MGRYGSLNCQWISNVDSIVLLRRLGCNRPGPAVQREKLDRLLQTSLRPVGSFGFERLRCISVYPDLITGDLQLP